MNSQQEQNLRNVVRALRESKSPADFTMLYYGHPCGTPACALGHYVSRQDLHGGRFRLEPYDDGTESTICQRDGLQLGYTDPVIREEFGIRASEATALFGTHGCDRAQTATDAADFIEAFIERKKAER